MRLAGAAGGIGWSSVPQFVALEAVAQRGVGVRIVMPLDVGL